MPVVYTQANDLLRYKINVEQSITVAEIASGVGVPESTIRNWMADISTVPPEILPKIAELKNDRDYIDVFLKGTRWELTLRQGTETPKHPLIEALDVAESVGGMISCLKEALKDKRFSPNEKIEALSRINSVRKELDDVEESIG